MDMKDDFIIIPGGQKCGATSLVNILISHPKIENRLDSSMAKKLNFFSFKKTFVKKNLEGYLKSFSENNYYKLEKSAEYLYNENTPHIINEILKSPKIIIILRDPVKRAYSNYLHMKKKIPKAEKRKFSNIVKEINGSNTKEIIKSENYSLKQALKCKKIDGNYYKKKYQDIEYKIEISNNDLNPYKYFQRSIYSNFIDIYIQLFEDVKIIFLEELIDNPTVVIKEVFNFLDLEVSNELLKLPHSNKTKVPKNIFSRTFLNISKRIYNLGMGSFLNDNVNKTILENIKKYLYKDKPKLSKKDYEKGKKILEKEYKFWFAKNKELEKKWVY